MPAPVFQEVQVGSSAGISTVVSASVVAANNHLYVATIHLDRAGVPAVSSVAGLGLTWSLVKAQCSGQDEHRVEVWRAIGTPTAAGAVTATMVFAPDGAYISVTRWSGVNAAAPIGGSSGYNTNGSGGACSGGVDSDDATGSVTVQAAGSVVLAAVACDEDFSHTSGWTDRVTNAPGGGATVSASVETKVVASAGAVTVGAANNLAAPDDWALVAVEIVGASPAATPRTLARFFDPHTGRPLRDIAAWQ